MWGSPVWANQTGIRLIAVEVVRRAGRDDETLVLWDVDRSAELRRFELNSADKAEEDRDRLSLKGAPEAPALLEIAQRRLRACDGTEPR
jgi:hypothetical protein